MNKKEIITKASEMVGFTKKDMTTAADALFDAIKETVASGEKVNIAGFGAFETTERAAREGRNPSTGESIHIEASKAPKFKASSSFKEAVKNA